MTDIGSSEPIRVFEPEEETDIVVQMLTHALSSRNCVNVDVENVVANRSWDDGKASLFLSLPLCGPIKRCVARLNVPPGLKPSLQLFVPGQQDLRLIVSHDESAARDMTRERFTAEYVNGLSKKLLKQPESPSLIRVARRESRQLCL